MGEHRCGVAGGIAMDIQLIVEYTSVKNSLSAEEMGG